MKVGAPSWGDEGGTVEIPKKIVFLWVFSGFTGSLVPFSLPHAHKAHKNTIKYYIFKAWCGE